MFVGFPGLTTYHIIILNLNIFFLYYIDYFMAASHGCRGLLLHLITL